MSKQIRIGNSEINIPRSGTRSQATWSALICGTVALACFASSAKADEGGVSVWLPGFFGSLAASPLQPGWSLTSIYYHTSVSAGADVSKAREITIGRIPANLNVNLSASLDAPADLALALPTYTFATPVFGAQATVGVLGLYGRVGTSLAATLSGTLTTPFGTVPFARSDSISDSVIGFGDVYPLATLRWNSGVHNVMTYVFGDVPGVPIGVILATRVRPLPTRHQLRHGSKGPEWADGSSIFFGLVLRRREGGSHCAMFQRALAFEPRLRHETRGVGHAVRR
jgi:hypothetical protein